MNTRTRSLISLSSADRQDQLRGGPLERKGWSTSYWVPVLVLGGVIAAVVLVLHFAEWID